MDVRVRARGSLIRWKGGAKTWALANPEPGSDREAPAAGVVDAHGDELQVKSAGEVDDRVEHCR